MRCAVLIGASVANLALRGIAAAPRTKAGNCYLRQMLFTVPWPSFAVPCKGTRRKWLLRLLERRAPKLAAMALAKKTARIAWAMMMSGERYKEPEAIAA
jgi:transposase